VLTINHRDDKITLARREAKAHRIW